MRDADVALVVKALHQNDTVLYLDLSRNSIGNGRKAAREIGNLIIRNDDLTELDLSWNNIRKESAEEIFVALGYTNTLERLDLSWNGFGETGGYGLGAVLRTNSSLKYINLTKTEIGPRAAFVLVDMLSENETIEELVLDGNPIGLGGGGAVLRALQWSNLLEIDRKISIHECNFDQAISESSHAGSRKAYGSTTRIVKTGGFEVVNGMKRPITHAIHSIEHFDPQKPAGIWRCNLALPYERAVANELLQMAWAEEGENWEGETLDGQAYSVPEPPPGILWSREDFSLPEEGILKLKYVCAPRLPKMRHIIATKFLRSLTAMMDDRALVDQGLGLLKEIIRHGQGRHSHHHPAHHSIGIFPACDFFSKKMSRS